MRLQHKNRSTESTERWGSLYFVGITQKKTRLIIDGRGGHWPVRSMK